MLEPEGEGEMWKVGNSEEEPQTPAETLAETPAEMTEETSAPPSGPGGLVIFGRLVQKHSYVMALIIMMVKHSHSVR